MSKNNNQTKTYKGKKPTPQKQQKPKVSKSLWITLSVVLVFGLVVGIYFIIESFKKETEVTRYDNITHLELDQFQALLGEDKTPLDDIEDVIKHDIYVFIYNEDYDVCTTCAELENLINEKALKEGRTYTFFVLNYTDYPTIKEELSTNFLPNMPVLVHIEGESILEGKTYTNKLEIQSALSKL
jgi:hypothetical protein